jgi:hypothetical protein
MATTSFAASYKKPGLKLAGKQPEAMELAKDQKWDDLRAKMDTLTEAEKQKLRNQQGRAFEKQMHEQMTAYQKMSPEEKAQHLREQIFKEEERRKQGEARRAQAGANGGNPGGGGAGGPGGPRGPGGPGGPGGNQGSAQAGGARGNGPATPQSSPQDRDSRRRESVDRMSPQDKQLVQNYRADMQEQKKVMVAQGLLPATALTSRGGFGGFGPPGGGGPGGPRGR